MIECYFSSRCIHERFGLQDVNCYFAVDLDER